MSRLTIKETVAKNRICVALDVSTQEEALGLVSQLKDYVGMFKVGLELYIATKGQIVDEVYKSGGKVFLDLKFHDTPNTVYKASKNCVSTGVYMFDIHISGGEEMCKAALKGASDGAKELGIEKPKVIGVSVLTSLKDEDFEKEEIEIKYDKLVANRTRLAQLWGLDGVVCPANKAGDIEKEFGPWTYITPGIEWAGRSGSGQAQLYTPDMAVKDCSSSILVIGRALTQAEDKQKTALEIIKAMSRYV